MHAVLSDRFSSAWHDSRKHTHHSRWVLLLPKVYHWLAATAMAALEPPPSTSGDADALASAGAKSPSAGSGELRFPEAWANHARGLGEGSGDAGSGGSGAPPTPPSLWRFGNGDAVESAAALDRSIEELVKESGVEGAGQAACAWCWCCCCFSRSPRPASASRVSSYAAQLGLRERTLCQAVQEATLVVPQKMITAVLATWVILAVATLWALGPLRTLARAATESVGALATLECASDLDATRPDLARACGWLSGAMALLNPLLRNLDDALTFSVLLSAICCGVTAASAIPAFLQDHSILVAIRARRGATLAAAVLEDMGLGRVKAGAALAAAAAASGASIPVQQQQQQGQQRLGGSSGSLNRSSSTLLGEGSAAVPFSHLGPLSLLGKPPLGGGRSGARRFAGAPPHSSRPPAATLEAEHTQLAAWRLGLDLASSSSSSSSSFSGSLFPGALSALHGLPKYTEFSHTLAWDYLPSATASALVAHALLTLVLTLLALCLAAPGMTQSALLSALAVCIGLVMARAVVYNALGLVLARWARDEVEAAEGGGGGWCCCCGGGGGGQQRRRGGGRRGDRGGRSTAGSKLALSRHFMLGDSIAAFSPIAYAVALAGALLRLLVGALFWPLSLMWMNRPFAVLGALDPTFATHAGLCRVAYMDQLPPGYQVPSTQSEPSSNPWDENYVRGAGEEGGEEGEEEGGGRGEEDAEAPSQPLLSQDFLPSYSTLGLERQNSQRGASVPGLPEVYRGEEGAATGAGWKPKFLNRLALPENAGAPYSSEEAEGGSHAQALPAAAGGGVVQAAEVEPAAAAQGAAAAHPLPHALVHVEEEQEERGAAVNLTEAEKLIEEARLLGSK